MPDRRPPAYCLRTDCDREYAVVTLTDSHTGRRRTCRLGGYGTPESHERYARLICEWEASGRRLPVGGEDSGPTAAGGPTVAQIAHAYWTSPDVTALGRGERTSIGLMIRALRGLAGSEPAAGFGPARLRLIRDAMVAGDLAADPPRRPWARRYVNAQIKRLVRLFKWAVAHELVAPHVHAALRLVEPLRRGRTTARESEPVAPAPPHLIDATRRFLSPQLRAMVDLQLATGMRPGELCAMRICDIDTSGAVWVYTVAEHKTSYRGKTRSVFIGPRGQKLLKPLLRGRPTTAYVFDPRRAEADRRAARSKARKTPLNQGNRPGSHCRDDPICGPGERYGVTSYSRAIARACEKAFHPPNDIAQDAIALAVWRREHRWCVYQLRHNCATLVRREHGLEAAQVLLGHARADVTQIYAERDMVKAAAIAGKVG